MRLNMSKLAKAVRNLLTKEETIDVSNKLTRSMKLRNEIEFGDSKMNAPDINFFDDDEQFYDSSVHAIHIGRYGITTRFEADSEASFAKALEFVQGHESQHVHSTASKPYAWGINRGVEIIMEYIASKEDPKKRFRREKDYEKYADELAKKGIYISWQNIRQIVAGIANSVEDGRIEGIRAAKYIGFRKLRTEYRGIFWRQGEDDELRPYEELSAAERLRIIANQILFLSTCQLYQPGFFLTYVGTPLKDEVDELIPYIAKGVSAKTCRDMAAQVVEICKKLAPLMYEAFKLSQTDIDAKKAIESMIRSILSAMIENGQTIENGNISENNEEQGTGDNPSIFGQSDLVITLPDDEYDKLVGDKEEEESGNGGIQIRREHPKEEEQQEDKPGSSGNGEDEESDEMQISDGGSNETTFENPEKDGQESSGGEGQSDIGEGSGKFGNSPGSEDFDSSDSSEDSEGGNGGSGGSSQDSSMDDKGGDDSSKGKSEAQIDTSRNREIMEAVEKAMKEAAETNNASAETQIDNINTANTHESRAQRKKENPDTSKPVSPEEMKDICRNFIEVKRAYKVTQKMPAVLEARCRAMYRKNKRYFKSLSTPNVSHLDSGTIDPSLITGLSYGDTEIFRKIGKDKKFDGCAYMLIDNSGSMYGNKRTEACKAAAVIEEGFKEIMPLKIVAFDEEGNIIHEVVKNWDEKLSNNCCWNFCVQGRDGSGNEDGYDIKIATRELLRRSESRKLLCILSDGAPGNRELVKSAVKEARKKGIEVYSIYFEEGGIGYYADDFKYMYEKDYVCCELSEVDENLSKLFKKFSRR